MMGKVTAVKLPVLEPVHCKSPVSVPSTSIAPSERVQDEGLVKVPVDITGSAIKVIVVPALAAD